MKLKENISEKTHWFFGFDIKVNGNKSRSKQVRLHQTKSFCSAKGPINKIKGQPAEWETVFANHVSGQGWISKIYEELI